MGILCGSMFGGFGVLSAVMLGLVFGSHIVSYAFHVRHHIPFRWLVPRESLAIFVCAVMGSIGVLWLTLSVGTSAHSRTIPVVLFFAAALIYLSLKNPNVGVVVKLFRQLRPSRAQNAGNSV
jgi:hypothetical protein